MFKQEVVCDDCDSQFIVVTRSGEDIVYCPFCSKEINDIQIEDEDEAD